MNAERQQFLKQVLIDSKLPTGQYIAALAARETALAAAGDYAEAARFKARREQLSTIYTGSGGAAIQLPLRNARAGGPAQVPADTLGSLLRLFTLCPFPPPPALPSRRSLFQLSTQQQHEQTHILAII